MDQVREREMKETGIIMSGDHPKLILDGRKTMTRRVIKPQPKSPWGSIVKKCDFYWAFMRSEYDQSAHCIRCPYGQVGDRLWVRETFSMDWWQAASMIVYKADLKQEDIKRGKLYDPIMKEDTKLYWKPSIHMPRWASRITLEITELRVERLQEISLADCRKEGVEEYFPQTYAGDVSGWEPRRNFIQLWNSLNEKRGYGWETNCWVWVIGFKRSVT